MTTTNTITLNNDKLISSDILTNDTITLNSNEFYSNILTTNDYYISYDNSAWPSWSYGTLVSSPNYGTSIYNNISSPEDILNNMEIKDIEQFLRKKKMENINRNENK